MTPDVMWLCHIVSAVSVERKGRVSMNVLARLLFCVVSSAVECDRSE